MLRQVAPLALVLLLAACGQSSTLGSTGTKEPLRFATSTMPAVYTGEAYDLNVQVSGGVNPYSYRVASGKLPPGMTLRDGKLTGTPTQPGRYEFTVEVSDATLSTKVQQLVVNVSTLPPVALAPVLPTGDLKADTRVPVRMDHPRTAKAARFQWRLPEGVQVTRVQAGEGGPLLLWKQTGTLFTLDMGFTKALKSGVNVALISMRFPGPTKLPAAAVAYEVRDQDGKLIGEKKFPQEAKPTQPTTAPPTGTPGAPTGTGTQSPLTPPAGAPQPTSPAPANPAEPTAPTPPSPKTPGGGAP